MPDVAVKIALEITAGQGTVLGSTFEEIAQLLAGCRQSDRLAVCFDTCHARYYTPSSSTYRKLGKKPLIANPVLYASESQS